MMGNQTSTAGWMPNGHKNGHTPLHRGDPDLPPSLREAIQAFILTCAIRRTRGQGSEHCSMLIHVTRVTIVQAEESCNRLRERDEATFLVR
jgi:hypothetical protein